VASLGPVRRQGLVATRACHETARRKVDIQIPARRCHGFAAPAILDHLPCRLNDAASIGYFAGEIHMPSFAAVNPVCNIKGNVSIGSGERISHVPGSTTTTKPSSASEYDERWFCSEAEARKAGWRRPGV
jgi:hypothetical protein